jgi:phosphotransferase system IIB component
MLWVSNEPWILWVLWVSIGVFLIGGLILFFVLRKQRRQIINKPLDEEIITGFICNLGGIANIQLASQDGARLKFTVIDIDKCNLEAIRNLGAMGIFVSENIIKMMVPINADCLIARINQNKKEE